MRRFISLSLSAAIAIFAVAAGVSEASQSIVNVAADTPELTTLVEAVIMADLVDALSDAEDAYTVFAPINAGFDTLLQDLGVESLDAIDVDTLVDVLQYHILPGALSAEDLTDATVAGIEALNGEMLSFSESFDGSTTSVQGLGSRGPKGPTIIQVRMSVSVHQCGVRPSAHSPRTKNINRHRPLFHFGPDKVPERI